jgi:hypothetical protein
MQQSPGVVFIIFAIATSTWHKSNTVSVLFGCIAIAPRYGWGVFVGTSLHSGGSNVILERCHSFLQCLRIKRREVGRIDAIQTVWDVSATFSLCCQRNPVRFLRLSPYFGTSGWKSV